MSKQCACRNTEHSPLSATSSHQLKSENSKLTMRIDMLPSCNDQDDLVDVNLSRFWFWKANFHIF